MLKKQEERPATKEKIQEYKRFIIKEQMCIRRYHIGKRGNMSVIAKNPIMPGFYPDPSMCAVGEDFYLVNSTFAYFPGLPILHSKDLVHFEQIGNVMDRESQLPLGDTGHSRGLFAPTIRYYNGTFYVICTNVSHGGNYIVTATSPEGPWSEPYYLEGADGIDPSLFFDEDGTCYYIGTHPNPAGCKYDGDWYIWIQQVDLENMKLVGPKKDVWNGAMRDVIWPEGPHLYRKDGYYYIMHAEGGTGPDHAVSVCRSKDIWGPYENYKKNPVLTHRHLGLDYPIKYVGHSDIVETVNGEWYMVMLAVRPLERYTTMGRETFLAKVTWEEGWPVVNPGIGMLTDEVEINLPEWIPENDPTSYTSRTGAFTAVPGSNRCYDFAAMEKLGHEFLMLRNPREDMYRLTDKGIELKLSPITMKENETSSYVAIRQQHHNFTVKATVCAGALIGKESAGLAYMQNNDYNLRLEVFAGEAKAILCQGGQDEIIGSVAVSGDEQQLAIVVEGLTTRLLVNGQEIATAGVSALSTEVAGGFVGCTAGIYASGNGEDNGNYVCFKSLGYEA